MKIVWFFYIVAHASCAVGFKDFLVTDTEGSKNDVVAAQPLKVPLTFIRGAYAKGAVCLDGTLPGYHLHSGFGSGKHSWLIHLEGGGWCGDPKTCIYRKRTRHGSSKFMERQIPFTGILSHKSEENPDFYNWNRVLIRYCDGASFSGDAEDKANHLQFRGERIWSAAMEDLMSKGMHSANHALLSGCSAGALASVLHCDKFSSLFSERTRVKCLADAGLFLDVADVSGYHTLRSLFKDVVTYQGVENNISRACTLEQDPTLCIFPQYLIANIRTPLFLLNAAYDSWQIQVSLAPNKADPRGEWTHCKSNYSLCLPEQINFLKDFRREMLLAIGKFSRSKQNGWFINSCFAHCQTERQDTWLADDSPVIGDKAISTAVADWYFDRAKVGMTDCAYPCDKTCHNLVFKVNVS